MKDRAGDQRSIYDSKYITILVGILAMVGLYLASLYSYNLFHSFAELFSIVVAAGIFMIAWNSRRLINNNYLLFIGIAYVFIGLIDLVHTLSYKGIGVFHGYGANLPTQLWIAGRYLQAFTLLMAPLFLERKLNIKALITGYTTITVLLLLSIFHWHIFPTAFVDGSGLTLFKRASEYIISMILLVSLYLLVRKRRFFDSNVLKLLSASMLVTVASEMSFTLYVDPYGFSNLIGHFLKIIAYYLIYRAIIKTGLVQPYSLLFRELKQSEEALRESEDKYRSLFTGMSEGAVLHEIVYDEAKNPIDYVIKDVNPRFEDILATKREEAIDMKATALFGTSEAPYLDIYSKVAETGEPARFETYFPPMDKYFNISAFSPGKGRFAAIFTDITEQKRIRELSEALNSINAAINSTLDFDEVMQRVVIESAKAIGAEAAAISLREGDDWVVRYAYGFSQDVIGVKFASDANKVIALAIDLGKTIAVDDTFNDERVNNELMKKHGIRSFLTIPLQVKEEFIGVLDFHYRTQQTSFAESQVDFANKLAISVSLALENIRLYEIEHRIADTLQSSILTVPQSIKGLDFGYLYRSAAEAAKVGGDFYDFFELEDNRVGFIIGDVSGKGLTAATITSLAKSTMRAFAYHDCSPSYVLAETNNAIEKQIEPGMFITAIYGVIDITTGLVAIASAGHPDPFICGQEVYQQTSARRNPPLGIFSGINFNSFEIVLNPGDTIVLYTDGLTEAKHYDELFGDDRALQALQKVHHDTPDEIVSKLLLAAEEFSQDKLMDDTAIVAIRFIGAPAQADGPLQVIDEVF